MTETNENSENGGFESVTKQTTDEETSD